MDEPLAGPRLLSARRRRLSHFWLAATVAFVALPLFAPVLLGVTVPFWLICFMLAGARVSYIKYRQKESDVSRAEYGARAEDEIAAILSKLPPGWVCERNIPMQGVGDVDFFLSGPSGKFFTLDVKAHSGQVGFDGRALTRTGARGTGQFERDFLGSAMRQALGMRERRACPFVTPVIVFSRADLLLPERKLRGVHVITKGELLDFLSGACAEEAAAPGRLDCVSA